VRQRKYGRERAGERHRDRDKVCVCEVGIMDTSCVRSLREREGGRERGRKGKRERGREGGREKCTQSERERASARERGKEREREIEG